MGGGGRCGNGWKWVEMGGNGWRCGNGWTWVVVDLVLWGWRGLATGAKKVRCVLYSEISHVDIGCTVPATSHRPPPPPTAHRPPPATAHRPSTIIHLTEPPSHHRRLRWVCRRAEEQTEQTEQRTESGWLVLYPPTTSVSTMSVSAHCVPPPRDRKKEKEKEKEQEKNRKEKERKKKGERKRVHTRGGATLSY
ncbi:hypothetical protein VC83_07384 [Pseudogymnoascus destructans]|uniref:Uncharacterized protein n=1 Tax=Pseudogymnoascus destructans TaxID=655981 RepID=A0A177A4N6_9PEZI|nr:uncharacterized protein VC83_07384 [Pseudogymnoascus destructans]OAF56053.1 hypothetical protein VC83_07384 [Pseudogymnoascus destructans]